MLTALLCGFIAGLVCFAFYLLRGRIFSRGPLDESAVASAMEGNEYPSAAAETAVAKAVSLIGRVHYFWGGKYDKPGECPEWGSPREVTSAGNSTTGTVRPFGLDCSGFVTWAYVQAGVSPAEIGSGTWNQWFASAEIEKSELRPGDLAFANSYPGSSWNHVGICVGFLRGKPVFAHCTSTYDNVVVTYADGVFSYFRRPFAPQNGGE